MSSNALKFNYIVLILIFAIVGFRTALKYNDPTNPIDYKRYSREAVEISLRDNLCNSLNQNVVRDSNEECSNTEENLPIVERYGFPFKYLSATVIGPVKESKTLFYINYIILITAHALIPIVIVRSFVYFMRKRYSKQ